MKKKSLVGWTVNTWKLNFERKRKNRCPEYIKRLPSISNTPMFNPPAKWEVKVRITIKEIK